MKKGWKSEPLGELCDIRNGSTPSKGNAAFWDGGTIPWFTIDDMREQGREISSTRQKITKSALSETSVKLLPEDSVLLCCTASVGEFAITRIPLTTNQQFNGLVVKNKNQLDPNFLFHYASTLKDELLGLSGKTTIDFIPISRLRDVAVPVPPLAEQQRIVGLLDEAFEGLATAKANAEKNLQNARALFESHLQSVFTQRGPGWVETTIGAEIKFIDYRGKTPVKTASGVRLITAKNVKMGFLQETPMEFIAAASYKGWMTRGIPQKGDVLFTTEAPLANVAQLDTDEKVAFAQRIIIMQPNAARLDSTFLKYLLISQPVQQRIRTKGTGATVQGIKASLLKLIEISFPKSLTTQEQIVSKFEDLREETQRLARLYERKHSALEALKKSLLHQAFTGAL